MKPPDPTAPRPASRRGRLRQSSCGHHPFPVDFDSPAQRCQCPAHRVIPVAPADPHSIPGGIGTPSPASCSQIHASRSWHASAKVGPAENGNTSNRCNRASSSPLASLLVAITISRSGMCCSPSSSFSAALTCWLTINSSSSTSRICHWLPAHGPQAEGLAEQAADLLDAQVAGGILHQARERADAQVMDQGLGRGALAGASLPLEQEAAGRGAATSRFSAGRWPAGRPLRPGSRVDTVGQSHQKDSTGLVGVQDHLGNRGAADYGAGVSLPELIQVIGPHGHDPAAAVLAHQPGSDDQHGAAASGAA